MCHVSHSYRILRVSTEYITGGTAQQLYRGRSGLYIYSVCVCVCVCVCVHVARLTGSGPQKLTKLRKYILYCIYLYVGRIAG